MIKPSSLFSVKALKHTRKLNLVKKDFIAGQWAINNDFSGKDGEILITPKMSVLIGGSDTSNPSFWANVCEHIPSGSYTAPKLSNDGYNALILGWALAHYDYNDFRKSTIKVRKIVLPKTVDTKQSIFIAEAVFLTRNLINTPANILNPEALEQQIVNLAKIFKAKTKVIKGKALETGFPMIYAVGKASVTAPRLLELNWGNSKHPTLTLIGKGITFDSGGLDLKPSASMLTMKKDMGGSSNVIGLAYMIMKTKLPVQLRVIIPSAENMIAGNAFRPMDILKSRKGITVEIGNTDAEGRLVLADAMTYASEKKSDLTIDIATLTGAARVAVGTSISAFFSTDKNIADTLIKLSNNSFDPMWQLPLHKPYRKLLNSPNADINSCGGDGLAGAIIASLFLQQFVDSRSPWLHLDIMAYNNTASAGKPIGGEAMGIYSLFTMLQKRYI